MIYKHFLWRQAIITGKTIKIRFFNTISFRRFDWPELWCSLLNILIDNNYIITYNIYIIMSSWFINKINFEWICLCLFSLFIFFGHSFVANDASAAKESFPINHLSRHPIIYYMLYIFGLGQLLEVNTGERGKMQ